MLVCSADYAEAMRRPHITTDRVDLYSVTGELIQRGVPILKDGKTSMDTLGASLFTRDVYVPRDALSPAALAALRNPTGVFIQSWSGVRHETTRMHGGRHHSAATWTPKDRGRMVSVKVTETGAISLGP